MRKINWDAPLSPDDKAWLVQSGMPLVNERIANSEKRFSVLGISDDTEPEDDEEILDDEDEGDDYEERTKAQLAEEVSSRKPLPEVGGNGNKADLIAALRAWDAEHGE